MDIPLNNYHKAADGELILGQHQKLLPYEALSWCWGREEPKELVTIQEGGGLRAFYVSRNLKSALIALRHQNSVRHLWIDFICINQNDYQERSQQVPRMNRIYGNASSVCVWLGEDDDDSKLAMDFIKNKMVNLWEFDKLLDNPTMARQWAALVALMKRPWFSRRWVIQEIAMASRGIIYCGKESLPWKDFADAVSLFVKVESARGRLADLMKGELSYGHMPGSFGNISSLGAAMLVNATQNLFRPISTTGERQPVLSLEYLVSSLSVFEATQPRDTIYALLSIAKDATRLDDGKQGLSEAPVLLGKNLSDIMMGLLTGGPTSQVYNVDYTLPVIEVYKEFIKFSFRKSDKVRALDILCRPWAPSVLVKHDRPDYLTVSSSKNTKQVDGNDDDDKEVPLPSWIPNLNGAAFAMKEHFIAGQPVLRMERLNADPLVGMPGSNRIYTAAGDRLLVLDTLAFKSWHDVQGAENCSGEHHCLFVRGFVLDEVFEVGPGASNGNMPYSWLKLGGWLDVDADPPDEFWRTLVADRGEKESNPPSYFPRACKEILKFKTKARMRGSLDIQNLISEGRCSTVAEFLRRVQEVIWNRHMIRTKGGRLGLVRDDVRPGDKVCILYGCSVPVIIRQFSKDPEQHLAEQLVYYHEWLRQRERVVLSIQRTWRMKQRKKIIIPDDKLTDAGRPRYHEDFQRSKVAETVCIDKLDHLRARGKKEAEQREAYEFRVAAQLRYRDYYRFLGESYVHGVMNGEAIAVQNRDELPLCTFEFR